MANINSIISNSILLITLMASSTMAVNWGGNITMQPNNDVQYVMQQCTNWGNRFPLWNAYLNCKDNQPAGIVSWMNCHGDAVNDMSNCASPSSGPDDFTCYNSPGTCYAIMQIIDLKAQRANQQKDNQAIIDNCANNFKNSNTYDANCGTTTVSNCGLAFHPKETPAYPATRCKACLKGYKMMNLYSVIDFCVNTDATSAMIAKVNGNSLSVVVMGDDNSISVKDSNSITVNDKIQINPRKTFGNVNLFANAMGKVLSYDSSSQTILFTDKLSSNSTTYSPIGLADPNGDARFFHTIGTAEQVNVIVDQGTLKAGNSNDQQFAILPLF